MRESKMSPSSFIPVPHPHPTPAAAPKGLPKPGRGFEASDGSSMLVLLQENSLELTEAIQVLTHDFYFWMKSITDIH